MISQNIAISLTFQLFLVILTNAFLPYLCQIQAGKLRLPKKYANSHLQNRRPFQNPITFYHKSIKKWTKWKFFQTEFSSFFSEIFFNKLRFLVFLFILLAKYPFIYIYYIFNLFFGFTPSRYIRIPRIASNPLNTTNAFPNHTCLIAYIHFSQTHNQRNNQRQGRYA